MILDIENINDLQLQRIINLLSFALIVDKKSSPDYILEKWEYWVGNDIKLKPSLVSSSSIANFADYKKIWGESSEDIKLIFYFLCETNINDIVKTVQSFIKFGGELGKILFEKKKGLHKLTYYALKDIVKTNENSIELVIRNMNIIEILED